MREIRIASVAEFGKRLAERRKQQGLSAIAMGEKLGVRDSTYGRWESGEQEGGCRLIAQAGAMLGMRPDELFLESLSDIEAPGIDSLPEDILQDLRRGRELVARIFALTGGKVNAGKVIVSMLESAEQEMQQMNSLPPGSSIKRETGDGLEYKVIDAPPAAGEALTRYGSKKRRKK